MVRFVDKPYVSDGIRPRLSSIKWKMLCGIGMVGLHFVTLSDNENDLFDIYPAAVFKQKSIRKSDRVILGVADSYENATAMIEEMVRESLDKCEGPGGIRAYYEQYVRDHV